jgi:predicted negative regulator of RcsB-dependent stress response
MEDVPKRRFPKAAFWAMGAAVLLLGCGSLAWRVIQTRKLEAQVKRAGQYAAQATESAHLAKKHEKELEGMVAMEELDKEQLSGAVGQAIQAKEGADKNTNNTREAAGNRDGDRVREFVNKTAEFAKAA